MYPESNIGVVKADCLYSRVSASWHYMAHQAIHKNFATIMRSNPPFSNKIHSFGPNLSTISKFWIIIKSKNMWYISMFYLMLKLKNNQCIISNLNFQPKHAFIEKGNNSSMKTLISIRLWRSNIILHLLPKEKCRDIFIC